MKKVIETNCVYGFFASPEILEIPSDARVLVALGLSLLRGYVSLVNPLRKTYRIGQVYRFGLRRSAPVMFLLRRKRVDGGETTAPTFKAEVPDLAEPNLGDAAAEAAAIKIQTIWRGRDFRQLLFWLFSQVDVGYEIRLSTQRIKQRSLFYGLCKRLLFFASILTVVFMHQGGSVRRAEDRPPLVA